MIAPGRRGTEGALTLPRRLVANMVFAVGGAEFYFAEERVRCFVVFQSTQLIGVQGKLRPLTEVARYLSHLRDGEEGKRNV